MGLPVQQLKTLLTDLELLTSDQFDEVASDAQSQKVPVESLLVDRGLVMNSDLGRVVAAELELQYVDLSHIKIPPKVLSLIPELVAKRQQTIAYKRTDEALYVATAAPDNFDFFKALEHKTGQAVKLAYTTPQGIVLALSNYSGDVGQRFQERLEALSRNPSDEAGVVAVVDLLLELAYVSRASDIHLEPLKEQVAVRFRIDSVLHEVAQYPKALHGKVASRIKIIARLRTDEHAAAQDGRFNYRHDETSFDVRVSVLPVTGGENIVMRLLAESARRLSLGDLGLGPEDLAMVKKAAAKPHGMILAVGPTGSGKTTTLYTVLQIVNREDVNIMTIEDPVEYDIEHVQQTQINPAKNLTFATGLRAIVRQDPDVIMVGEIRDEETADIAVNSAMTGHLVLSTLHTNDAATTFPRLLEMGVEPFLVASSINVVVAQRLVRRICDGCRGSVALSPEELSLLASEPVLAGLLADIGGNDDLASLRVYRGTGCPVCGDTGYSGRVGIFEVLPVTDAIRTLITQPATADVIAKQAVTEGMTTMMRDGVAKVFAGVTTLSEIIRVTKQ